MTTYCTYSKLMSSLWQTHRNNASMQSLIKIPDLSVQQRVTKCTQHNVKLQQQQAAGRGETLSPISAPLSLILTCSPLLHSPCYSSSSLLIYHSGAAPFAKLLGVKMRFCVTADNKSIP